MKVTKPATLAVMMAIPVLSPLTAPRKRKISSRYCTAVTHSTAAQPQQIRNCLPARLLKNSRIAQLHPQEEYRQLLNKAFTERLCHTGTKPKKAGAGTRNAAAQGRAEAHR